MKKPWLIQYPKGVPAEIDMQRFASLVDVAGVSRICRLTGRWA